jgi:hypothetical protein
MRYIVGIVFKNMKMMVLFKALTSVGICINLTRLILRSANFSHN